MKKPIIYFLCTGNSCRSQMAEGFGKAILSGKYEISSAGIEAHGLNPMAVEVMKEAGVDISGQKSELIDRDQLNSADFVITLCGDAEERCPVTPPHVKRMHWGVKDPARAKGTREERLKEFRKVRDEIRERIRHFSNL